jgi:hypothetical protein
MRSQALDLTFLRGQVQTYVLLRFTSHSFLHTSQHLFYDGQWKDGKQHGNGFVYSSTGNQKFLGTWSDGKQTALRPTSFKEIENLAFYKSKGEVEFIEAPAEAGANEKNKLEL